MVTPEKNLFNCFGCQVGGGVIDWVMKAEAVEQISAELRRHHQRRRIVGMERAAPDKTTTALREGNATNRCKLTSARSRAISSSAIRAIKTGSRQNPVKCKIH